MNEQEIDSPEVLAEVTALFHAYESALMANNVETLLGFFWADARLTRYGIGDRQRGIAEMIAFRRATAAPEFSRELLNLRISAFGPDMAVAQVEFTRSDSPLRGFQSQTWVRLKSGAGAESWKIVAAHVSMVPFND